MKAMEQRLEVAKLKGLEAARSTAGAREALDPQQKLIVPAETWVDSIRKENQRLSGGFGFHAPTAVSEHVQPSGKDAQAQLARPLLVRYFLMMY